MDFILRVGIPIFDSLVCFAASGLIAKLTDAFPDLAIEEEWCEIGEYSRLESFVENNPVDTEIGKTMLRQLRTKQVSHGPTFRFIAISKTDFRITEQKVLYKTGGSALRMVVESARTQT